MNDDYIDHYAVLGVENDKDKPLTSKELAKAYRKLALLYHPDKQAQKKLTEAERKEIQARFEKITQANEVLQDAGKRATFDAKYFAKRALVLRYKEQDEATKQKIDELRQRESKAFAFEEAAREGKRLKRRIAQIRASDKEFIRAWEERREAQKTLKEEEMARQKDSAAAVGDSRTQLKLSWSSKKYTFTVEKLSKAFAKLGEVENLQVYGKKKNRGVVRFKSPRIAALALQVPDSISVEVRGLHLEYADEQPQQQVQTNEIDEAGQTSWRSQSWQEHLAFEEQVKAEGLELVESQSVWRKRAQEIMRHPANGHKIRVLFQL